MSLNYGNSTISIKNSIPIINWALFNSRANTDSATASEPAVGQCLFARYYSSLNAGTPSFLLIPSRFKSGKLYAQIPTNGSGDLNVTRSLDTATRVNSSGLVASVASGIPRLDYFASGGTVGCPGLLVEPSGTNLIQRSEEFNDAYWGKVSGGTASAPVVTPNVELAPDGTNNADRVVFALNGGTLSTDLSSINSATLTHSAVSFTSSVYIRTTDGSTVTMTFVNADGTSTNKTITPTYQRITYTSTGAGTAQYRIRLRGGVTSDSASVAIWGAQYEVGPVATSYIPTTTAAITRNADVVTVSGAVSGFIGQTEGTIYAEINIQKLLGTTQRAIVDIGQSGNRLFLGYGNGLTNQIRFLLQTSGGGLVDFQSAATTTGTIRVAVGYKDSDSAMYVNGVNVTPTSNGSFTGTLTTLSNIYIGSSLDGLDFLNDKINEISLFSTRLTNTALQNMTI